MFELLYLVRDFFCFFGSEIFVGIFMLIFLLLTSGVFKNWIRTFVYGEDNFLFTSYDVYSFYLLVIVFIFVSTFNSEFYAFYAFDTLHLFENSIGSTYLKQVILGLMFLSSFSVFRAAELVHIQFQEIVFLLFGCMLSSMLLVMSTSLISIFLCLEFLGLCFYTLAAILRSSIHSADAGLHYFIANAIVSGCFLAGCAIFYGFFGTLGFCSLDTLFWFLAKANSNILVAIGCLLIFISFSFKLLIAPFHLWQPLVYFGAPVSATIVFCVISKIVIFTPLLRITAVTLFVYPIFIDFFIFLGFFTFIYGGMRAFFADTLKFVLIYSSMNQVGVPISLVGFNDLSSSALIYFFLIIYSLVSIVAWIAYVQLLIQHNKIHKYINRDSNSSSRFLPPPLFLTSLRGLWFVNRSLALKFIFVFFSFAGIPPLVGFLSKSVVYYEMLLVYSFFWIVLFVFFGSLTVIYYLRLIKLIFEEPKESYPSKVLSFSAFELFQSKIEDGLCLFLIFIVFILLFNADFVLTFCRMLAYSLFFSF